MKTILATLFAISLAACGDDAADPDANVEYDGPPIVDGGAPDADCVTNPVTSQQILNACTSAQRIDKEPVLPLRLADGGLPPLPP